MDSMRRPVGHLPSTVYWRRRVVVLLALALLIALVAWACTAGGDSDDKKNASDKKPIPSGSVSPDPSAITPGANPTNGANPPIPGGSTGTPGGTSGASSGTSAGTSAGASGQPGGQSGQAGQSAGGAGTPGGGTVPGGGKPAPGGGTWCTPAMIRVQIQPVEAGKSAYNASQNVALKVIVTNESGPTCYVDLAPSHAYIEVLSGSDRLWSSADCAAGPGTDVRQIQQGASQAVSITRDWAWTRSDPRQCATNGGQTKAAPADKAAYRAKGVLAGLEPSGEFIFTATVGK
ncbi:hypothetical protein ACWGR4_11180 [Embleya sp. NPDC055664]|uniref:hypothetical protein n=1 Tax=Embleya sp. NPDC059237 TaxID=3346784 RepID=UPI0036CBC521